MNASLRDAIPISGISPLPDYIFLLNDFKALVQSEIQKTDIVKRFKPRLYSYVDFIIPIIYALVSSISIEQACQELNNIFTGIMKKEHGLEMREFSDGVRKRRLVPHQTSVDKFLRLFTENEAQQVFGNILAGLNDVIKKDEIKNSKVKFIADNTKYPYYGSIGDNTVIGAKGLPGTGNCRMFQGHSVYGAGVHLFTYFGIIKKGKYRPSPIYREISWLRWLGYKISYALIDREFYRVRLVHAFKKLKSHF